MEDNVCTSQYQNYCKFESSASLGRFGLPTPVLTSVMALPVAYQLISDAHRSKTYSPMGISLREGYGGGLLINILAERDARRDSLVEVEGRCGAVVDRGKAPSTSIYLSMRKTIVAKDKQKVTNRTRANR